VEGTAARLYFEQFAGMLKPEEGELRDLALHIIASHHGMARPVIAPADPAVPPSKCPAVAQAVARRFEQLTRSWGPWELAWLETIFRPPTGKRPANRWETGRNA
jgi:CRISPR-associated endonuclease/helicase Cas3